MAKAKTDTSSALDRSPSHLLHRAVQRALDIYADVSGPQSVTQRQFAVLSAVNADEGLTQTGLVKATGIDRSTLADLVTRMIAKDLVQRERSASDARANTIRMTPAGRAALEAAIPRARLADETLMKLLPSRKREGFIAALEAMASGQPRPPKGERKALKKSEKKARKAEKKARKAAAEQPLADAAAA